MEREIVVGTARGEAGRWTTGRLTLGYYPDGPITSPVNILCGEQPGPVLWVQSAIHGDEPGGAIGSLRLLKRCDPKAMKGAIIMVMAANPTAFRSHARNTPFDCENMNRCFPGDPNGGHSSRTASILMETASSVADVVMDLHSGGIEAIVPFYAIYREDGSATSREARRLARATGTPDIWACQDAWLDGAMFVNFVKQGKPAVIVECGGGGLMPEAHIENFASAVEGVARAIGIIPGEPTIQPRYRTMGQCFIVFNQRGGFFAPAVSAGDIVEKGQPLGRILSPHGEIVEEVVSPNGPGYVAALSRPYLPVYSGAWIAETIQVLDAV